MRIRSRTITTNSARAFSKACGINLKTAEYGTGLSLIHIWQRSAGRTVRTCGVQRHAAPRNGRADKAGPSGAAPHQRRARAQRQGCLLYTSSVQNRNRSAGMSLSSRPFTSTERFFAALPSRTSTAKMCIRDSGCTRRAKNPQYIAENILNRDFHAKAPNEKWLTDVDRKSVV